jgi:hypothetical protein
MELRADAGSRSSRRRRPPVEVPDHVPGAAIGMTDRVGRVLTLGRPVLLRGGDHEGRVAEVVGGGGSRGVEVLVHGPRPAFLAVPAALVEVVDAVLLDPIARPPRAHRSAPAGGWGQPDDPAAGESQPDRRGPRGAGAVPGPGGHDQDPRLWRSTLP